MHEIPLDLRDYLNIDCSGRCFSDLRHICKKTISLITLAVLLRIGSTMFNHFEAINKGSPNPGNPVITGARERIRTSDLPLRSTMNGNENAERISIIVVTRSCSSQFSSHYCLETTESFSMIVSGEKVLCQRIRSSHGIIALSTLSSSL